MKKAYIVPSAKSINFAFEGLVAVSNVGLNDGDNVGNTVVGGGTDNDFSNRRGIWDNIEW